MRATPIIIAGILLFGFEHMPSLVLGQAAAEMPALVMRSWNGTDSHIDESLILRVTDEAAWQALWEKHAPGSKAPEVDFSNAMVIAIFSGEIRTRVIPAITLADVAEGDKITLTVQNFVNDVITEDKGNLYLITVLKRSAKPVRVIARSISIMGPSEQVIAEFDALPLSK
jgi:hypothetical protein